MANVIAFAGGRAAPQKLGDQPLINATLALLQANGELAMAINGVMNRLALLEAEADCIADGSRPSHRIDIVIEQDRTKIVDTMAEVLDAIHEYAIGLNAKMLGLDQTDLTG